MKSWEKALNKFLERYIHEPWFEGALLCGSYATGNQNKFSDIDVTIVASNDIGWQEKSNCYVDGFLMEYIIQPVYKYQEYMKSGYENNAMLNQNMFAYGKILYDKRGVVKKLRQQSIRDLQKPFKPKSKYTNDFMKYHLWEMYDELKSLKHDGYHIDLMYWTLVNYLITAYANFNCLWQLPKAKIEKFLTDKEYAKRYHAEQLPDKKFTKLLLDCFNAKSKDKMSAINKLYNYVIESGGGFDIGKFRGYQKIGKK
ncbi:MAG: nucleotidyltransferase domain-containing protein [Alphaproteobacteria bacterium]|nr:nucleotidyltransferase domain-containing protein [Alphaproteobacteria bacterium]